MTRAFRLTCVALLVCATAGVAAAKPSIAILGLEVIDKSGVPNGDDVSFAKTLTEDLRGRAKIGGPYSLANNADKELIDLKLLKGCDDEKDLKCMASIGGDLQADFLMYGSITKKGGNYEITITLLDVKAKKREKTAPQSISIGAKPDEILKKSQKVYNGLTGQTDSCTITVKTPGVDRATILIGSKESGNITNGIGQVNGLSEGKYNVAVEAKDYHRWSKDAVQCSGGETTNITAELSRTSKPDLTPVKDPNENLTGTGSPGVTIGETGTTSHPSGSSGMKTAGKVVMGVGIAGAVVGGAVWIYGYQHYTKNSSFNTTDLTIPMTPGIDTDPGHYGDGKCNTPDGDAVIGEIGKNGTLSGNERFKNGCTGKSWTTAGPIIMTGGLLVGIGGYLLLTLSHDSETPPVSVAGRRKHHEPFAITPVVGPTGAGATFRMEW